MEEDEPKRRWVWISSEESRAAGKVSVLACVETVLCVIAYWVLMLWFGVTWHHWLIVVATPLVLMRSNVSIFRGVQWYKNFFDRPSRYRLADSNIWFFFMIFICYPICIISPFMIWGFNEGVSKNVLVLLYSYLISSNLIVSVATAIFGVWVFDHLASLPLSKLARSILGILIPAGIVGYLIGIAIRAFATRSLATALSPFLGLIELPTNWRSLALYSDLNHPPELVPEHKESGFEYLLKSWGNSGARKMNYYLDRVLLLVVLCIFFVPTILWRWAIKSTAWFYFPLLWVGRGWQNLDACELLIWAKSYSAKWLNRIGLTLAAIFLTASVFALFMPGEFLKLAALLKIENAPMSPLGYLLVLDWSRLIDQPWQWFYLPSWILTLTMFFRLDHHANDIQVGADESARLSKLTFWMWVGNARTVLTNIGLGIALIYFLRAVDAPQKISVFWTNLF